MTLAALEATLRIYLDERRIFLDIPYLRMVSTPLEELQKRAERILPHIAKLPNVESVTIEQGVSYVGGGSLPDESLPTVVLALTPRNVGVGDLAHALRTGTPAVVGRVRDGQLFLDLRTVFPDQDDALGKATCEALAEFDGTSANSDSDEPPAPQDKSVPSGQVAWSEDD